jgi:hypothetical protein
MNRDPVSEKRNGVFLLIALESSKKKLAMKVKSVGKGEAIFRLIVGGGVWA